MHDSGVNIGRCRRVSADDYENLVRNNCKPLKNDVLIAKDGSYLKHTFVVGEEQDVVILSSIAILRPSPDIRPNYLSFTLREPTTKARMTGFVSGVAIPRIVLKDFRNFRILVPPSEIQTAWSKHVDPKVDLCRKLISRVQNLRRTRDLLLPRLLVGPSGSGGEPESWPTPTPKTSSSSSPPSGCSPRSAGRRCRRWRRPSAPAARSVARPRARSCWWIACAPRWAEFNPALPPEAINTAIDELTRDRSAMSLEAANREIYRLLKDGIPVSVPDREHGGQKTERLRVIDWANPEQNDFLLVSQFSVVGNLYTCRPDLVGFVNGLPVGGDRTQEAWRAGAHGLRRQPYALQARDSAAASGTTRCSSLATARTAASARSPPTGTASSSGSESNARTSRAACRWR